MTSQQANEKKCIQNTCILKFKNDTLNCVCFNVQVRRVFALHFDYRKMMHPYKEDKITTAEPIWRNENSARCCRNSAVIKKSPSHVTWVWVRIEWVHLQNQQMFSKKLGKIFSEALRVPDIFGPGERCYKIQSSKVTKKLNIFARAEFLQ